MIDIPFEVLPVYQILAKKHNLDLRFRFIQTTEEDSYRISFYIKGKDLDKKRFEDDLDLIEMYEDKIDKIFGIKIEK